MKKIRDSVRWRRSFLRAVRHSPFSLREKMSCVLQAGGKKDAERQLLMNRLCRPDSGEPYFYIDGHRIFFRGKETSQQDEAEALRGALIILKEAFIDPPDFFSDNVQIKRGDTVLDLGGNIGTSALLFSRLAGESGRVISFEPVSHDVLARNLKENRVQNAEAVPLGVADRSGSAIFKVTGKGIDARLAPEDGVFGGADKLLPLTTIDEVVVERGLDRVDFIKMDIEGAEEFALRGASDVLGRFRPKLSIASYHTDPSGDKQHRKIVRHLKGVGYRIKEVGESRIYAWGGNPLELTAYLLPTAGFV